MLVISYGGNDPGAIGLAVEKTVNLEIALACRDYLVKNDICVKMSREKDENDALTEEIRECNAFNPDLAVDIHSNSSKGDGFEVFYYHGGGKSQELARNIEKEIISIGQNSRGCKTKVNQDGSDYFGFIRQTNAPAVIVEGFFLDNAKDFEIADTIEEQRAFGIAYAKGILKTLGVAPKPDENNNTNLNPTYKVQVGAFKDKTNAENLLKSLKEKGFKDAYIRQ